MYTDIHKCAEINNISDCSLEDHPLFQILHIKHIRTQDRLWHLVARITPRLAQLLYDIWMSQILRFLQR